MRGKYLLLVLIPVLGALGWVGSRVWVVHTSPVTSPPVSQMAPPPTPIVRPAPAPVPVSPATGTVPAPPSPPQPLPVSSLAATVVGRLQQEAATARFGNKQFVVDQYSLTEGSDGRLTIIGVLRLPAYPGWMGAQDWHGSELHAWLETAARKAAGLPVQWWLDDLVPAPLADFATTEQTSRPDGVRVRRLLAATVGGADGQVMLLPRPTPGGPAAAASYWYDTPVSPATAAVLETLRRDYHVGQLPGGRIAVSEFGVVRLPREQTHYTDAIAGFLSVQEAEHWRAAAAQDAKALEEWVSRVWDATRPLPEAERVLLFTVMDVVASPPAGYSEGDMTYLADRRILVVRPIAVMNPVGFLWLRQPAEEELATGTWPQYTPPVHWNTNQTYLVPDRARSH